MNQITIKITQNVRYNGHLCRPIICDGLRVKLLPFFHTDCIGNMPGIPVWVDFRAVEYIDPFQRLGELEKSINRLVDSKVWSLTRFRKWIEEDNKWTY